MIRSPSAIRSKSPMARPTSRTSARSRSAAPTSARGSARAGGAGAGSEGRLMRATWYPLRVGEAHEKRGELVKRQGDSAVVVRAAIASLGLHVLGLLIVGWLAARPGAVAWPLAIAPATASELAALALAAEPP